ncbi:MAG: hypothetical protein AB1589_24570 [Cyanobacteriota bacterium]
MQIPLKQELGGAESHYRMILGFYQLLFAKFRQALSLYRQKLA